MSTLAAIDPGGERKGCSLAQFTDGELTFVSPCIRLAFAVDHVCVERPQQDGRSRAVPPAILMDLAWQGALLAGGFVALGARLTTYTPEQWKGTVPKAVHHSRIWDALTAQEREILGGAKIAAEIDAAIRHGALSRWKPHANGHYATGSRTPDILDAVGLGLFHLGRIGKDGFRK